MITSRPIDISDLSSDVGPESGARVFFAGVVRDRNDGRAVTGIFYDCYREMASGEIERIVREVCADYPVSCANVVHRVGELKVGDVSLVVVVDAAHRREAFDACQRIIEDVKQRVPIWKKERYTDETAAWL